MLNGRKYEQVKPKGKEKISSRREDYNDLDGQRRKKKRQGEKSKKKKNVVVRRLEEKRKRSWREVKRNKRETIIKRE